ncbi:MAG: MoaE-MoaD fusion protein [Acidobacteriota bacterium]|jgi:molybdopterin synthase catalytic subunit|nr:MoaE-MoaD fusion protein [Acidobacteriota bacterium]
MTSTVEQHTRQSDASISVRVLFFGAARETVGHDEVALTLRAPANAASAFEEILSTYPQLRQRFGRSLLCAVNQEYARGEAPVRAGDELAIFPPVSGGAGEKASDAETRKLRDTETLRRGDAEKDFFELTTEPIDVGAVARRIVPPHCGATVTLDGYVREWTRGRRTLYLIYEAYPPMALSEMQRLAREAHTRFEITHIGIVHRTGRLEIGETSVVICVSAPHRRAAFEACEWAIRELKRTVPIWKKEFYEDGEVWVEGEGAAKELLS